MIASILQRWFALIWLTLWPAIFLGATEQPYVTCRIEGQLGNQLFMIAATLAYAWDNDTSPIFPELNRGDWNIPYNRQHIFFRLDPSSLPRPIQNAYHHPYFLNSDKIPYRPDQYLTGFFQSWKYFHHQREKILEALAPSESINDYLQIKYGDILAHPNTVAVHVRTYSPEVQSVGGLFFLGLSYFERAMGLFPEDTLFIVFSDRINWCKHHFLSFNKNIVYAEGNDHIQDLFLMSKMKHHIISNSTFSWWGSYLNINPNKIVIAPSLWVNPRNYANLLSDNLYFADWIILDVDYDAPYPKDIRNYDTHSKSMDNQ